MAVKKLDDLDGSPFAPICSALNRLRADDSGRFTENTSFCFDAAHALAVSLTRMVTCDMVDMPETLTDDEYADTDTLFDNLLAMVGQAVGVARAHGYVSVSAPRHSKDDVEGLVAVDVKLLTRYIMLARDASHVSM